MSRVFNLNPQEKLKESKRREPCPWEHEGCLDKGRGLGALQILLYQRLPCLLSVLGASNNYTPWTQKCWAVNLGPVSSLTPTSCGALKNHFSTLGLSFLTYKVGVIICTCIKWVLVREKEMNCVKALGKLNKCNEDDLLSGD